MVSLFIDTDIGPDCDDAGALEVAHALRRRGLVRLIGVTHCTSSPYGAPTISAINRHDGFETPIGTTTRTGFLCGPEHMRYSRAIAERFDHEYRDGRPQLPANRVFRSVLATQPDQSVTVMGIGPMNNLAEFIGDEAGMELVRRKVTRLVAMAGRFDCDQPEWNVQMDVPSAQRVMADWPTEVVLCGWELGGGLITGAGLEHRAGHPVREAYRLWSDGRMRRDGWDLVTTICAVRGECGYVHFGPSGRILVTDDGRTRFVADPEGTRRVAYLAAPREKVAGYLDMLLSGD